MRAVLLTMSGMSLINIPNKSGPRTLPCGIPEFTSGEFAGSPPMTTVCIVYNEITLLNIVSRTVCM